MKYRDYELFDMKVEFHTYMPCVPTCVPSCNLPSSLGPQLGIWTFTFWLLILSLIAQHHPPTFHIVPQKHKKRYPTNIGFAEDQLFPSSISISPPNLCHSSFLLQTQIQPSKSVIPYLQLAKAQITWFRVSYWLSK